MIPSEFAVVNKACKLGCVRLLGVVMARCACTSSVKLVICPSMYSVMSMLIFKVVMELALVTG